MKPISNIDDHSSAMRYAQMLSDILSRHGLRSRTWGKPGVGARVYVGDQYLSVSRGGDVSDRMRGQVTFVESALYPSQRAEYRRARDEYRREQDRVLGEQWEQNPAAFTTKGERLYEQVKRGYGRDPRAKSIAAATVYKQSAKVPGLVRARRNPVDGPYTVTEDDHR